MKTITTIIAAILLTLAASAQQDKLQDALATDTILYQIYNSLPAGWTMSMDESYITVFRVEKFALIENDCANLNPDSLPLFPRNETAFLRFLYEDKWDSQRIFWTSESNDSLNMLLASLPQQMGVTQLYDAEKSTRFNKVYTGKTKDEKNKVKKYYDRKSEIMQQITSLPNFNSSEFSLRLVQRNGFKKKGTCKFPFSIDNEFLGIEVLLSDYFENPHLK